MSAASAANTPVVPGNNRTDPSALTTQQLGREITMLRELLEALIAAERDRVDLLQSNLDQRAAVINTTVNHLERLVVEKFHTTEEKFTSIRIQFAERDKRTEQLSLADKTAVAAALQAAKELVGTQNASNALAIAKSESSMVEAIRQLQTQFTTVSEASNDRINDVKSRIDRGEGRSKGMGDGWTILVAAIGVLIPMITVIVLLLKQ